MTHSHRRSQEGIAESRPQAEGEFASAAASVRDARLFVDRFCRRAGVEPEACKTAALLTSEVVTNAFLHGRSNARLSITAAPDRVRVEVGDDNSRHPQMIEQRGDATNGRGLLILDALALDWGVLTDEHGKCVWFEIALDASPEQAPAR